MSSASAKDAPAGTAGRTPLRSDTRARMAKSTALLLLLLVAAIILGASAGAVMVPPSTVAKVVCSHIPGLSSLVHTHVPEMDARIVWEFHIPRMLLGALVGMCLAMGGAVLQGLLLNPLADPYMIGVSSGASVGAGIAVVLGIAGALHGFGISLCAFGVALISVSVVYGLSRRGGRVSILSFILAGVVVGAFMWAALTFAMSVASQNLETIIFWTMGSLAGSDPWSKVTMLTPVTLVGLTLVYAFARDLNVFALGEESARYLGIDVESLKKIIILLVTIITAAAVSVSGTIGFVGLMVPHIARRLFGPDHRVLIPSSALLGAVFMIAADTIARTALRPTEIPIGVITALLGAPFFLYLLRKSSDQ